MHASRFLGMYIFNKQTFSGFHVWDLDIFRSVDERMITSVTSSEAVLAGRCVGMENTYGRGMPH